MAEKCDLLEYYRSKRLFSFVVALICLTVIVIFVEEYAEEANGDSYIKANLENSDEFSRSGATSSELCWVHERVSVIESCIRCSEFEMQALKVTHCGPTGYYDRVNCSNSGIVSFRPCYRALTIKSNFYCFLVVNVVLLLVSYYISLRRIAELNRRVYIRLTPNIDG
ncbi:jumping translocation breakpoint protein [Dictyocaulus viviparus]|uniref:Jumping translocation breakpoint protein n=1 Tax=Dictyocaulus viviparus TaxID=29172 RepID=A0A0D8XV05_DICVI|nr:jumping translocation breakpoint protein [Dictyocaulus viviparus]